MRETDTEAFVAMLSDVYGFYPTAKPLAAGQVSMFMRAVAVHPIETIRLAFDAHVRDPQRGRFAPLPADVIAQIEGRLADDSRPSANEAWAIAVRADDEATTVVWTDEIAQAWGVARPVMQIGDEVGARIAFRDSYDRLVEVARKARQPTQWNASLGHDPEGRTHVLTQAAALGRLPHQTALVLDGPKRDPAALKPLLEAATMPEHIRDELLALRGALTGEMPPDPTIDPPGQDFLDKQRTDELRLEQDERVRRYAEERGIAL